MAEGQSIGLDSEEKFAPLSLHFSLVCVCCTEIRDQHILFNVEINFHPVVLNLTGYKGALFFFFFGLSFSRTFTEIKQTTTTEKNMLQQPFTEIICKISVPRRFPADVKNSKCMLLWLIIHVSSAWMWTNKRDYEQDMLTSTDWWRTGEEWFYTDLGCYNRKKTFLRRKTPAEWLKQLPKCRCTVRCLQDDVCSSRSSIFTGTNCQRAADKFDHMLFFFSHSFL